MFDMGTIHASIDLDTRGLRRGRQEALQAFAEFGKSADAATKAAIVKPSVDTSKLNDGVKRAGGILGSFSSIITLLPRSLAAVAGSVSKLASSFGTLGFAVFGIKQTAMAFSGLIQGMVAGNIAFEQYYTQFAVLLRGTEDFTVGVERAKVKIAELAQFAAATPFNLPEIVESSKLLRTFGGAALDTAETLKMVGDMAAGVGRPFQEIAFWVGRVYTNIKAGKPFGEAALRLQEMGLLSGEARAELEALTESGASSDVVWAKFGTTMGRFGGMMEELSKTLGGLLSTLKDEMGALQRDVFQALMESVKTVVDDSIKFLQSDSVHEAGKDFGKALGQGFAYAYEQMLIGVKKIIGAGTQLVAWFRTELLPELKNLDVAVLFQALGELATPFQRLLAVLPEFTPVIKEIVASFVELANAFGPMVVTAGVVFANTLRIIASVLAPIANFLAEHTQLVKAMVAAWLAFKVIGIIQGYTTALRNQLIVLQNNGKQMMFNQLMSQGMTSSQAALAVNTQLASSATAGMTMTVKGLALSMRAFFLSLGPIGIAITAITIAMTAFPSVFGMGMGKAQSATEEVNEELQKMQVYLRELPVNATSAVKVAALFQGVRDKLAEVKKDILESGDFKLALDFQFGSTDNSGLDKTVADLKTAGEAYKFFQDNVDREGFGDIFKNAITDMDASVLAWIEGMDQDGMAFKDIMAALEREGVAHIDAIQGKVKELEKGFAAGGEPVAQWAGKVGKNLELVDGKLGGTADGIKAKMGILRRAFAEADVDLNKPIGEAWLSTFAEIINTADLTKAQLDELIQSMVDSGDLKKFNIDDFKKQLADAGVEILALDKILKENGIAAPLAEDAKAVEEATKKINDAISSLIPNVSETFDEWQKRMAEMARAYANLAANTGFIKQELGEAGIPMPNIDAILRTLSEAEPQITEAFAFTLAQGGDAAAAAIANLNTIVANEMAEVGGAVGGAAPVVAAAGKEVGKEGGKGVVTGTKEELKKASVAHDIDSILRRGGAEVNAEGHGKHTAGRWIGGLTGHWEANKNAAAAPVARMLSAATYNSKAEHWGNVVGSLYARGVTGWLNRVATNIRDNYLNMVAYANRMTQRGGAMTESEAEKREMRDYQKNNPPAGELPPTAIIPEIPAGYFGEPAIPSDYFPTDTSAASAADSAAKATEKTAEDIIKAAADAAKSVSDAISGAVDMFKKLSTFNPSVDWGRLHALTNAMREAILSFGNAMGSIGDELLTKTGEWAEKADSAITVLSNSFDLFQKMRLAPIGNLPIVELVNQLRFLVAYLVNGLDQWQQDAAAVAGRWSEAIGGFIEQLSAAFDLFQRMRLAPIVGLPIRDFLNHARYLVAVLVSGLDQWQLDAAEVAGRWSGSIGVFLEQLSGAFDLFQRMRMAPMGGIPIIDFLNHVRYLVAVLANGLDQWQIESADVAGRWAASIGGFIDTLVSAFELFQRMRLSFISGQPIVEFVAQLKYLVAHLAAGIDEWQITAADMAARWSGSVGAIVDTLVKGLEVFERLKFFRTNQPIVEFLNHLRYLIAVLVVGLDQWQMEAVDVAARWAGSAGVVVDALAKGLEVFEKLSTFTTNQPVVEFVDHLRYMIAVLVVGLDRWQMEAVDVARRWADSAGAVVNLLAAGLDVFERLSTFNVASVSVSHLIASIKLTFTLLRTFLAEAVDSDAVELAARWADGAGRIVALVGTAVEAFIRLETFSDRAGGLHISGFVAAIKNVINEFAKGLDASAITAVGSAARWAESAQKIVSLVQSGVDAFTALRSFSPSVNVGAFIAELINLERMFAMVTDRWGVELTAKSLRFAEQAQIVVTLMKSTVEAFSSGLDRMPVDVGTKVGKLVTILVQAVKAFSFGVSTIKDENVFITQGMAEAAASLVGAIASFAGALQNLGGVGSRVEQSVSRLVVLLVTSIRSFAFGMQQFDLATADGVEKFSNAARNLVESFGILSNIRRIPTSEPFFIFIRELLGGFRSLIEDIKGIPAGDMDRLKEWAQSVADFINQFLNARVASPLPLTGALPTGGGINVTPVVTQGLLTSTAQSVIPLGGTEVPQQITNHFTIEISALDGASVRQVVPEIAYELDRHLQRQGSPGLA